MPDNYDLIPKIPIQEYGALLKLKEEIICNKNKDPDYGFEEENKETGTQGKIPEELIIPKDSILFYVKDEQFVGMSKYHKKPMSAWVRLGFVTSDQQMVWYTLLRQQQRVWDSETYRRKKKMILKEFNNLFEIIETGDDENYVEPNATE